MGGRPRDGRSADRRLGTERVARNLLAETPDVGWETPHGRYELFGGHRLWFAPEDPDRVAVPDGSGLIVDPEPHGIRLTGLAELPTGLVRSMVLRLTPGPAGLEVCHELQNVADRPIELAPWSITQLPLGGTVLLPQRPPRRSPRQAQPHAGPVAVHRWEDPRFRPRDGLLTLDANAGPTSRSATSTRRAGSGMSAMGRCSCDASSRSPAGPTRISGATSRRTSAADSSSSSCSVR